MSIIPYFYDADVIGEPQTAGWNKSRFTDERDLSVRPNTGRGPRKAVELNGSHGTLGHDGHGMRMTDKWNNPAGRNKRSVWTIPTQPTTEAHFATFPEELVKPCVLAGCPEGGTMLDPFAGRGTVGVVALRYGRNFLGIELNPKYVEMARRNNLRVQPLFHQEAEVTA